MTDNGIQLHASERTKNLLYYFGVVLDCPSPVLDALYVACLAQLYIVKTNDTWMFAIGAEDIIRNKAKCLGWSGIEDRFCDLTLNSWLLTIKLDLRDTTILIRLHNEHQHWMESIRFNYLGPVSYTTDGKDCVPVPYGQAEYLVQFHLKRLTAIAK